MLEGPAAGSGGVTPILTIVNRNVWLGPELAYAAGDVMDSVLYTALGLTVAALQVQVVTVGPNTWTVEPGPGADVSPLFDFVDEFDDVFA